MAASASLPLPLPVLSLLIWTQLGILVTCHRPGELSSAWNKQLIRRYPTICSPLTSQFFRFHLAKARWKGFSSELLEPSDWKHEPPLILWVLGGLHPFPHSTVWGSTTQLERCLGTICFQKACMFVIFRTSVLDPFGCSPKESHADLVFNLSSSHALFPTPKRRKSLLRQLRVRASEAF